MKLLPCPFERIEIERLARVFGVSLDKARQAQDDLGFIYRELASPPNAVSDTADIRAKLEELQARSLQQPISYKWLFDQAHEIACEQFMRAMIAEAALRERDSANCCLGLPPEDCAKVPGKQCDGT